MPAGFARAAWLCALAALGLLVFSRLFVPQRLERSSNQPIASLSEPADQLAGRTVPVEPEDRAANSWALNLHALRTWASRLAAPSPESDSILYLPLVGTAPPPPRYVILFIGDGMGFEQVRAGSYYATGQAGGLSFESLPYQAQQQTYSAGGAVTDFSCRRDRHGHRPESE